ncbi:MAG TPA: aldehyde dehydrogenase family protein [Candidatus Krumholzibacteria bacterium]|nr:aldehyde dehydrogenase family protein [Candidatus Krumholzibacteria bacterium]
MLKDRYPYYLANRAVAANTDLPVTDKFTGDVVTRVAMADDAVVDSAVASACDAVEPMRALHGYERRDVLMHCVTRFSERRDELAEALCIEAGKPIRDSRGEVDRLIDTFRVAAEEATRMVGEVLPLDISARARDYRGMWKRVPIGVCSFITPFNFPLNLVAHKVAPALAVGCPFVLKPASATPVGALIVGDVLSETSLPPGAFSILPVRGGNAARFAEDPRIKLLSFTGSPAVGWDLKQRAGKKKMLLELGGNAAVIVDADADIDDAVSRIIIGAFYQSGQSCISVQRIMVHRSIYDEFKRRLVAATATLVAGNPRREETFIGPMISEAEAERLDGWIRTAVERGATVLAGGRRKGAMLEATLLENVPADTDVCAKEAFGPVAVLSSFEDFDAALDAVNDSVYGLQAGVFTRDIYRAYRAWDRLDVGGVIVGDVPSWRVDHMPYGGVKESGQGREGIRFAMEEMTETRLFVLRTPGN